MRHNQYDFNLYHTERLEERVRNLIGEEDDNGCMPWNGKFDYESYPIINVLHQTRTRCASLKVHRYIMYLNGEDPLGYTVRHLCNNTVCCNYAHLELGDITNIMNIHDRMKTGKRCYKTPLQLVAHIRYLHDVENYGMSELKRLFADEISSKAVQRICLGYTFQNIKPKKIFGIECHVTKRH